MSSLDQLVKEYVTPGLASAGFEKVGRVFRAVGATGDHAFLWYSEQKTRRAGPVQFSVTASILTTTYWTFLNRNEPEAGPLRPDAMRASLVLDLEAPTRVAAHPAADAHHPRQSWAFDTATQDDCGGVLAEFLTADVAPWLVHRLDRTALLEELRQPTRQWRGGPYGANARAVLALRDDGPIDEIERLLPGVEDVTPDGSMKAWIRDRLDARRRSEGAD